MLLGWRLIWEDTVNFQNSFQSEGAQEFCKKYRTSLSSQHFHRVDKDL